MEPATPAAVIAARATGGAGSAWDGDGDGDGEGSVAHVWDECSFASLLAQRSDHSSSFL